LFHWRHLLVWLALGTTLNAQALVLGAEDAAGPWGQTDGSGCGNEIVRAAFQAAGVPVSLRILPYARAKEGVLAGTLAGCFAMSASPELEGKVLFSREPLYSATTTFVRGRRPGPREASLERIPAGARVGIVNDYEYPQGIRNLAGRGVTLASNLSEVANLEMLAAGRLGFAVLMVDELKNLEGLLARAGVAGQVEACFSLPSVGSYVGFSLSHPQGRRAKQDFDKGFAIIRRDGTLRAILKRWKAKSK
jgi:ABC-type amino acid transport substrate-binding protein